jgi:hypothetical protein
LEKWSAPSPFKIGRLDREAPEIPLGDNAPVFTGLSYLRGQRLVGIEVQIALDAESLAVEARTTRTDDELRM